MLGRAAEQFEALGRGQFAYPTRWQQGRLTGGDEGRELDRARRGEDGGARRS